MAENADRPSLYVECPYCRAPSGRSCITRSGRALRKPHRLRTSEALRHADVRAAARSAETSVLAKNDPRIEPRSSEMFKPGFLSLLPSEGAWVQIMCRPHHMPSGSPPEIREGNIFWASRSPDADREGRSPDGTYKIVVTLPSGVMYLFPWEYRIVSQKSLAYWVFYMVGMFKVHPLSMEEVRLSLIVFYARSRGISLERALGLALCGDEESEISGPVCWFEKRKPWKSFGTGEPAKEGLPGPSSEPCGV